MRKDRWINLQYTHSISIKNQGMFFHCVLGAFSIGDRSQRIREACCHRQTGPGVAPCKHRCWEGVFSCGTEQNQEKKQPSIGWHLVINNDGHKDGQSGALLQMGAPLRYHQGLQEGHRQRWKVTNYIYSRYCNWVAFLCTCTFLSNFFNL